MKHFEKTKAQSALDRIQQGRFDANDVDSLLMRLRESSYGHAVFRELADFVAHNRDRDRGITNESMEYMYLRMKFFSEYSVAKKQLDLSQPVPLYFKRLMILQVDKLAEGNLAARKKLKERIGRVFIEDKSKSTALLTREGTTQDMIATLRKLSSVISATPAITQEALVRELMVVLRKNKLSFKEKFVLEQAPRITLAALLLLNGTQFKIGSHKPGSCRLSCDKPRILLGLKLQDVDGKETDYREDFGCLQIQGTVVVDSGGNDMRFAFPVMTTSLRVEEWCDPSLFKVESVSE